MTHERSPAVAGRFYPQDAAALRAEVRARMAGSAHEHAALALVGPHAGYIYSGDIAAATWGETRVPPRVVLLAPNHTGLGPRVSLWDGGAWQIPGATIAIDDELAARIEAHCEVTRDRSAHLREHAIEVHLPLLVARRPDVRIVPIVLGRLDAAACRRLGVGMARAIDEIVQQTGEEVLVVASTDMSHYIPADVAAELDGRAIDRICALDPDGLHAVVEGERISMCGYVPTTVALHCALARGARAAALVRYGNSGETSGDFDRVVGYAGITVQ